MADYITLTSDSSIDIFPENRIGSFRCKLPKKIYLDRKRHQVGLKYISWPHKVNNIEDGAFRVRLSGPPSDIPLLAGDDDNRWNVIPHTVSHNTRIPTGYYDNPQEVVDAMNSAIQEVLTRPQTNETFVNLGTDLVSFEYDRTTDVVSCNTREDTPCRARIILSKELFVKLGFGLAHDRNRSIIAPKIAPHTADLHLGKNAIFVYSDILELNRLVGNKMLPLLAIVPYKGERGKVVNHEPNSVEYCDLRFDSFDEIKIDLVGDTGEILKFLSGKVFVTLHIKDKFA